MSWLISLIIAGTMFSSQNSLPSFNTVNYAKANFVKVSGIDETERFEKSYPLNANGRVSVENVNGSITIEGWDKNEVKVEAVKSADTREHLNEVEIQVDARQDVIHVEANYDDMRRNNSGRQNSGNLEVQFHLMVPRNAMLNEIEIVNGSVNVSGVTNLVRASAVNGQVKASNLRGTTDLSTVNGTIETDLETLQAVNQIKLSTVNGHINLTIPSDANAIVKADSVNGKIANDFGLPVQKGEYVGNNLYGRIGNGDVKIKLESVNGEIAIRRKQDGKSLNQITNLLSSSDEQGATDDAVRERRQQIKEQALAEARREIESGNQSLNRQEKEKLIAQKAREKEKLMLDKMKDKSKNGSWSFDMPDMNVEMPEINVNVPEINVDVQKAMAQAQKEMAIAKINSADLQSTIKQAMDQQKIAMDRLREANWFNSSPYIETKSESFVVKGNPKVVVDASNCAVFVRGWDRPEVKYSVTRLSGNANYNPLETKADHSDSEVDIKIVNNGPSNNDSQFSNSARVRIEVFVPRKSNLTINTNREIRLENVSGELNVTGGEESVDVRDSDGSLNVTTADGRIRVIGFKGAVDAKTEDGLISLEGDFQKLSARTGEGKIILNLPENTNATIESNQKDIASEGISMIYQGEENNSSLWQIGKGGERYSLSSNSENDIFIRSVNSLKVSQ